LQEGRLVVPVQADEVAEVFEKVTGGFFFVCFGDATDLAAREGMNGWMGKKVEKGWRKKGLSKSVRTSSCRKERNKQVAIKEGVKAAVKQWSTQGEGRETA
jgi:hypothetical protein